jgi:hypothetical protein
LGAGELVIHVGNGVGRVRREQYRDVAHSFLQLCWNTFNATAITATLLTGSVPSRALARVVSSVKEP